MPSQTARALIGLDLLRLGPKSHARRAASRIQPIRPQFPAREIDRPRNVRFQGGIRMDNLIVSAWEELTGRAAGPLHLRLIFQPLMACFLASRAGMRDAREGRTPFAWTVAKDPAQRRALLLEGWKDIANLFVVAVVLDVVYSLIVLHRVV